MKKVAVTLSIVAIIALISGVLVYFNFFNLKTTIVKQFSSIPVVKNIVASNSLSSAEDKINKEMDYIRNEKIKLQQKADQLNAREAALKAKEDSLAKLQKSLDEQKSMLQSQSVQIKDLVKYYENMDPQAAAGILEKIQDSNKVAIILKNMQKQAAAQIMEKMNPDTAAKITQIMMGQIGP